MIIVRLYRSRYSAKDATGAKSYGGRWNSPGNAVLYASSTLALSCLEVLVHIRDSTLLPYDYMFCEIEIPDALVAPWSLTGKVALSRIESEVLSREWGDAWLKGREQMPRLHPVASSTTIIPSGPEGPWLPVLAVPSVIIPREMNYLINPAHPKFDELIWREPEPFRFDRRLIGRATSDPAAS